MASELTDERVEAAARAMYESNKKFYPGMFQVGWEVLSKGDQEGYMDSARAALVAAAGVAALDGAPEPEWEYGLGNRKSPRDAGIPYPDEAHVRWLASALEETPTFGPQLMRRRKAGPWLPVEGESK